MRSRVHPSHPWCRARCWSPRRPRPPLRWMTSVYPALSSSATPSPRRPSDRDAGEVDGGLLHGDRAPRWSAVGSRKSSTRLRAPGPRRGRPCTRRQHLWPRPMTWPTPTRGQRLAVRRHDRHVAAALLELHVAPPILLGPCLVARCASLDAVSSDDGLQQRHPRRQDRWLSLRIWRGRREHYVGWAPWTRRRRSRRFFCSIPRAWCPYSTRCARPPERRPQCATTSSRRCPRRRVIGARAPRAFLSFVSDPRLVSPTAQGPLAPRTDDR